MSADRSARYQPRRQRCSQGHCEIVVLLHREGLCRCRRKGRYETGPDQLALVPVVQQAPGGEEAEEQQRCGEGAPKAGQGPDPSLKGNAGGGITGLSRLCLWQASSKSCKTTLEARTPVTTESTPCILQLEM